MSKQSIAVCVLADVITKLDESERKELFELLALRYGSELLLFPKKLEPLPKDCDLYTMAKFDGMCKRGEIIDYDGFGQYSDGVGMSTDTVSPSDVTAGLHQKQWSHVVWFNR